MTATRLPARSTSWFHRAEWKSSPWKPSMPSMSGSRGSESAAGADDQGRGGDVAAGGPHVPALGAVVPAASSTVVSNRNRSSVPDSSATCWM